MLKQYIFIIVLGTFVFFVLSFFVKKTITSILIYTTATLSIFFIFLNPITRVLSNKQADFVNIAEGGLYLIEDNQYLYHILLEDVESFEVNEEDETAIQLRPVTGLRLEKTEKIRRSPVELISIGKEYEVHLNLEGANSKLDVTLINYSSKQLILNIPQALKNSFFEPIPKKGTSMMQLLSFFENLMYIFMLSASLFWRRNFVNHQDRNVYLTLLLFVFANALILGWVTAIAGALVRYLLPANIAIIVLFIQYFRWPKSLKKL